MRTVASISKEVRGFEEKVLAVIRKNNMLDKGDKVLVSVSGGPDSIALLYFLSSISSSFKLKLHIFHLDHQVRGEDSIEDSVFVQKQAASLNIPITSLSFDIPGYIPGKNLSLQEGAREIRYQLLGEVCDDIGADRIATGHNADDCVETFLMRVIRGTGTAGLRGIPPVRGRIIRPLIEVSRGEIEEYLASNRLDFRLDETNLKMDYLRNRVRHKLIPLCLEENQRFSQNILDTISIISDDEVFLDQLTEKAFKEISDCEGNGTLVLEHRKILNYPLAIRRRILRKALQLLKGNLREIEFKHIDLVLSEIEDKGSGQIDLPGGIVAINEYGNLVLMLREGLDQESFLRHQKAELNVPGVTTVPLLGIDIVAKLKDAQEIDMDFERKEEKAYLDFDKIDLPLWVRTRFPGDRFVPLGMSGEKKLQDFFVDNKIPKRKRDKIPIIESQGQIIWIGKMVIDNRVKVTKDTEKVLVLEVK